MRSAAKQAISQLPTMFYYSCLDISQTHGLKCKADNFAIIIVRLLNLKYFNKKLNIFQFSNIHLQNVEMKEKI